MALNYRSSALSWTCVGFATGLVGLRVKGALRLSARGHAVTSVVRLPSLAVIAIGLVRERMGSRVARWCAACENYVNEPRYVDQPSRRVALSPARTSIQESRVAAVSLEHW